MKNKRGQKSHRTNNFRGELTLGLTEQRDKDPVYFLSSYTPYMKTLFNANQPNCRLPCPLANTDHYVPGRNVPDFC